MSDRKIHTVATHFEHLRFVFCPLVFFFREIFALFQACKIELATLPKMHARVHFSVCVTISRKISEGGSKQNQNFFLFPAIKTVKQFFPFFFCSLLASASRDRLIHIFDISREYSFLQTLDDHSSSITAIRFLKMPPRPGVENSVQIASCGADKSIIFRDISSDHKGGLEFTRGNHIVGKTTLYDMETDVSLM